MKEIKIAIIGAYPYNGNRGVGALSWSILFLLKKLEKEYNCSFKFFLLNPEYGNKQTDTFEIEKEKIDVTNVYPIDFFNIKSITKSFFFLPRIKRFLSQYKNVDFVLNVGAGDSFSDIYGKPRFFYFDNQSRMAFLLKKRVLFLPQTIGPFNDKKIKAKAIDTVEKCDTVLVRDKQSYDFLKENTKQKNIAEIVDMAFFMPYQKKTFSKEFIHVGLNVSALLWYGGYTKDNQFNLTVDYPKLIRNIIDYFLSIPNVKLHLVSHVVNSDYHVENDYAVSFHLTEEYSNDRLILSPFFLTPILAKNYIAGMDFFAGARMHAAIAAFSSKVPVYPMAYSRKFDGLFLDTLDYPYMSDMKVQTNDEILNGIKSAFEKRDGLKTIIQERMTGVVAERKELLKKYLIDFLKLA